MREKEKEQDISPVTNHILERGISPMTQGESSNSLMLPSPRTPEPDKSITPSNKNLTPPQLTLFHRRLDYDKQADDNSKLNPDELNETCEGIINQIFTHQAKNLPQKPDSFRKKLKKKLLEDIAQATALGATKFNIQIIDHNNSFSIALEHNGHTNTSQIPYPR